MKTNSRYCGHAPCRPAGSDRSLRSPLYIVSTLFVTASRGAKSAWLSVNSPIPAAEYWAEWPVTTRPSIPCLTFRRMAGSAARLPRPVADRASEPDNDRTLRPERGEGKEESSGDAGGAIHEGWYTVEAVLLDTMGGRDSQVRFLASFHDTLMIGRRCWAFSDVPGRWGLWTRFTVCIGSRCLLTADTTSCKLTEPAKSEQREPHT